MIEPYWLDDDNAPFATMLQVIDTYCNPNADNEAWDRLTSLAHSADPPDRIMRFKTELRRVLEGDRAGLHPEAVYTAAEYDDGSDEAFLQRLWNELYPDEPAPQRPAGQGSI